MKRTLHLSSVILLAWGCARDPGAPPPAGGQSGDDGDADPEPPGPGPIDPAPQQPDSPCEPEETELGLDAATAFGASAHELVERLELGADSPLFWAAYDSLEDVTYTPGPSEASIAIGIEAESATELTWRPESADVICPDVTLRVAVRATLRTSDGAFDELAPGVLEFTSANTAHLGAELAASDVRGSFTFERIRDPEEGWESTGFNIQADFWPGGSRGEISPSFATTANLPASPPTSTPGVASSTPGSNILLPSVPSHFRSIAVWPRLEACDAEGRGSAAAYAANEPVIGWSLADVVREFDAHAAWPLTSGEQQAPVHFSLQMPAGLQCVRLLGRSMTFDVIATLSADSATGTPFEDLDATSIFEVTATSAQDGAALQEFRWVRRDVVFGQPRASFEAATGLQLSASDQYQQVWWSWHGTDTRQGSSADWVARGEIVVNSLNAAQTAEVERVEELGGPGPGISFDDETQFPKLPGDALLEAEISP